MLPEKAEALLRQALTALAAGRLPEAAERARGARQLAPEAAELPFRLAQGLAAAGRPMDALSQYLAAWRLDRETPRYRLGLARAFGGARLSEAAPAVVEALAALLDCSDVDPQEVAPAAQSLLRARYAERGSTDDPAGDALSVTLLSRALVTDEALEAWLRGLRQGALQRGEGSEGLLCLLALQADLSRHAWWEEESETAAVDALANKLGRALPQAWTREVILLACYRALPDWAAALPRPQAPLVALVHRRLVEEPAAAREAANSMPCLTTADDETSQRVKQQYEANPYPRWVGVTRQPPQPLAAVLGAILPGVDSSSLPQGAAPRVLVAGCGTGAHALRVASRYAGAEVLAVDLSRASLGYAAMKARALGATNLRFAEADLLALGDLQERFDLIECSGVLHHLAEPERGLERLVGLLAPQGVMKLGLYARAARRPIASARALLAAEGFEPTVTGLRAARRRLLALAEGHPARRVTQLLDFQSLDGLRDLLFHEQERSYDLKEVEELLDHAGLDFLGFELADPQLLAAFRRRNPAPGAPAQLALWQAFEAEAPERFATMYQFWCRPRTDPGSFS